MNRFKHESLEIQDKDGASVWLNANVFVFLVNYLFLKDYLFFLYNFKLFVGND
jgi:hypothetical protein